MAKRTRGSQEPVIAHLAKGKRTKGLQKDTQKIKDRATHTPLKTVGNSIYVKHVKYTVPHRFTLICGCLILAFTSKFNTYIFIMQSHTKKHPLSVYMSGYNEAQMKYSYS